jgi:uncharacterized protein HemY
MIHARAGDWTLATKSLNAIAAKSREKPVAAFMIAAIRAHSGDVAGALTWANSLPSPSLRAWAIRGLAYGIYDETAAQF